jgi:hypothetical protein
MGTVIIRDDEADARSYYAEIQRQHPGFSDKPKIGTADQLADRLRPYVELGFRHIFFDASAPFDRRDPRAVRHRGQAEARGRADR